MLLGKSHRRAWRLARTLAVILTLVALSAAPVPAAAQRAPTTDIKLGASGLPVPRFVSLKSNRVNVRKGPSTEHAVAWVFSRAGLPVEVLAESGNWRQIRDSEGSEGWVFHALLSGRRTALVMPWITTRETSMLRDGPAASAGAVARLEPGVLGSVHDCDGEWCSFTASGITGWIEQQRLWGIYRDEKIE